MELRHKGQCRLLSAFCQCSKQEQICHLSTNTIMNASEPTNELDVLLPVGLIAELLQANVALEVFDTIIL